MNGSGYSRKRSRAPVALGIGLLLTVIALAGCVHEAEGEEGYIAVTAWTPHFMFSQWTDEQEMSCLDDPGWDMDGETEFLYPSVKPDDVRPPDVDPAEINTYVTHTLEDRHPEVFTFLQNFQVTAEAENELMLRLQEGEEHVDVAQDYVDNNPDVVEMWMEGVDLNQAGSGTIRVGIPAGWDGEILRSHMIEHVLMEEFGLSVETDFFEAGPIYAGLANEDLDVFAGGWQPIQASHLEGREDLIVKAGDALPPGDVNLCFAVPQYLVDMGITSLADLDEHADEFGRVITGIESGAGMMITAEEKMERDLYNLGNWTLQSSSTPAMLAAYQDTVRSWEE